MGDDADAPVNDDEAEGRRAARNADVGEVLKECGVAACYCRPIELTCFSVALEIGPDWS
ncbi:uncharacterized protein G2W53_010388 [Senna tora]|uniref:Uncharacterized protein n=1 Tax=Senna tora TaxID=362788 RepID=A0A835C9M2_9FABA|nr:uncharacterized protein G2W53_010388 [Senna tora]